MLGSAASEHGLSGVRRSGAARDEAVKQCFTAHVGKRMEARRVPKCFILYVVALKIEPSHQFQEKEIHL